MSTGAEAARTPEPTRTSIASTPIRTLPVTPQAEAAATDRLIRRLATDRIRDLRDEGVTVGYIARMYGVTTGAMETLIRDELPHLGIR
jgi:hypothetical protein